MHSNLVFCSGLSGLPMGSSALWRRLQTWVITLSEVGWRPELSTLAGTRSGLRAGLEALLGNTYNTLRMFLALWGELTFRVWRFQPQAGGLHVWKGTGRAAF